MNQLSDPKTARQDRSALPLAWLYACACTLLIVLIAAGASITVHLRDGTLQTSENNLGSISLTLAEHANRSMQGLDLVLGSIADFAVNEGVIDSASFAQKMAGENTYRLLKEKLTGLPYIHAVSMIGADGRLINYSLSWPAPQLNVGDRDYFKALAENPASARFVSLPAISRADGVWTVYVTRPVRTPDGRFAGLVLGAIELRYFEDLYHAVQLGPDATISLLRDDGVVLARYPSARTVVRRFNATPKPTVTPTVIRAPGRVDGRMRLKAASNLPDFPMFVLVTETEAAVFAAWTDVAWTISLAITGCVACIVLATVATARGWSHQRLIGLERAERAEAERARALSEAELARAREQHAEEGSRAKSGFLAMMSHEIRTPMNAVLGLAGTLLDEQLPPQQRRAVEAIRDSGDSLLRILNDILDFSKLDAGRMTLEDMPFSPATLTHNIVSILGPRASAKGLVITAICAPSLPVALLGDAGRIRQILLNLVSNAVKFTAHGSVAIEALCPEQDAGTACIEWVVSDTGIGIAPDRLRGLFGEFIQMDSSIHRRFGGSGLGLAICKRLADQMGGSIVVASTIGQGTTVRLRLSLPLCEPPAETPVAAADIAARFAALQQSLGRPLRVLFAEDNPTNQYVALQLLKGFDVQVDVVGDGLEAVGAVSSFVYDAIFMDVRMPEMDGLAATRLIRQRGGHLAKIPIIALTANAFAEDVQACLAAGMNQFVPKPVHKDELLSALVTALSDPLPMPPAAPPLTQPPPATPGPPDALDLAGLAELTDAIGDDGVAEMITVFERETHDRLARLAEPIEDAATLAREVHTLKGAARTVCACGLGDLAAAVELRLKQTGALEAADVPALRDAFETWRSAVRARIPEAAEAT